MGGEIITRIAYSVKGMILACGTDDGNGYLFDTTKDEYKSTIDNNLIQYDKDSMKRDNYINVIKYSSDGKYIAFGGDDKMVKLYRLPKLELIHTFDKLGGWVWSIDFNVVENKIAIGTADDRKVSISVYCRQRKIMINKRKSK